MEFVYVLDLNDAPLMPTRRFGKVRRMLRDKKAKVVRRKPFTIKLLYEPTTHIVQELTLGVDTGSAHIGAAVYGQHKIYYQSQTEIRNDIKKKMDERRGYRRQRRNLNTRYRKPRWLNRANSIKKCRFSPTMISKFNAHIREIEFIKKIMPIKTLVLETGTFDPHLMKHEGEAFNRHWGYQKGLNYEFANTKAMILNRDNYICQCCKGKHKDSKLEVHHIVFRSQGGSDEESNLITLCHTCHSNLHAGKLELKKVGKVKGQLKHATQMNSIRVQLLKHYSEAVETFGYTTKENRLGLGINKKDHYLDACVIASGGDWFLNNDKVFYKKVVRKGNRVLQMFRKVPIHLSKGRCFGFRRYDTVKFEGKEYFIYATSNSGSFIIQDIFGVKPEIEGKKTKGSVNWKDLGLVNSRRTVLCT